MLTQQGPHFHLTIDYANQFIQKATFIPSKAFTWEFQTPYVDRFLEQQIEEWLINYGQKQVAPFDLPFNWARLTPFTQQVLKYVASIPFGQVHTYGQVAQHLNVPRAARAVGRACGANPFPFLIPCHRVIDAQHQLRGYSAGGVEIKQALLTFENISF